IKPPDEVTVTLVGRAENLNTETVNFGLPLPPGFLDDAGLVRVVSASGKEMEAAVRSLEPWRVDGKQGSIRSLQIQFRAPFEREKTQTVKIVFGRPPRLKHTAHFIPVSDTLIDATGLKGPRVLAVIPAKWLCDSWIVGPQVPAADSGPYSAYDR